MRRRAILLCAATIVSALSIGGPASLGGIAHGESGTATGDTVDMVFPVAGAAGLAHRSPGGQPPASR